MNKQEKEIQKLQKQLSTILIAATIISEAIDEGLSPKPELIEYKRQAESFKKSTDSIIDRFYKNKSVSGSLFVNTMVDKFEYIMRKEYKV